MIINKTNIKLLLGESSNTYDTRIDMIIPQLIDSIVSYCNNNFIMFDNYSNDYVYDDSSMVFTNTTITLTTTIPINTGDFIRIYGTCYNDGIYQVNSYNAGVITIENVKTMRAETITSAYIAIMDIPSEFINMIATHIKNSVINDSNINKEKIDDTEVTYFKPSDSNNFISSNLSILGYYRKVFNDSIFEVES